MKTIRNIICFLALLTSFGLAAQEEVSVQEEVLYEDVVYLINGSVFRGQILSYHSNGQLVLKALGGHELTFSANVIKKVVQERITSAGKKKDKSYAFKEKGIYHQSSLSINSGSTAWNGNLIIGSGFQHIVGYQFMRQLGLGMGLGVDYYNIPAREIVFPLFVELRTYLNENNTAPFFALASGYSFAFKNEDRGIIDAKGGFMTYPSFGFRLGASDETNVTLDAGVKFQKSTFTRAGWALESFTQEMLYKRLTIRLGLLF